MVAYGDLPWLDDSYDSVARKSEESHSRSQTVALIVVATDNLFTLVFLERL